MSKKQIQTGFTIYSVKWLLCIILSTLTHPKAWGNERPVSVENQHWPQKFVNHLELGNNILREAKERVIREGLQTVIGLNPQIPNHEFDFLDSLHEVTLNSLIAVRVILSRYSIDPYVDEIFEDYFKILSLIDQKTARSQEVIKNLTECSICHPISDDEESYSLALSTIHQILHDGFGDEIYESEFFRTLLTLKFAFDSNTQSDHSHSIDDFNINIIDRFIKRDSKWILLQEVNLANLYLLARGPLLVEKFTQSSLGQTIGRHLKIPGVIKKISTLSWPMNSILMWVLIETADGCIIRYAYLGYSLNQNKEIQNQESKK